MVFFFLLVEFDELFVFIEVGVFVGLVFYFDCYSYCYMVDGGFIVVFYFVDGLSFVEIFCMIDVFSLLMFILWIVW